MKQFGIFFIIFVWFGVSLSQAATPADSQIKGALYDIQKYEKQFSGKSSANSASIKRSMKLLNLTRGRLDSSPNKSHPSWIEANDRYNILIAHMNQLLNPAALSTGAVAVPATSVRSPTTTPNRQQAATGTSSDTAPKLMISQYRVRIKKLARDMESNMQTLNQAGVKPFQDSSYVAKFEKSINRFKQSLGKYDDFKDDPDVVTAYTKLAEYENMVAFGQKHAAGEIAALGNVQAKLAAMDQSMHNLRTPETPQEPFEKGALDEWITALANIRQQAVKALGALPGIKQRAYLPLNSATVSQGGRYDFNDVIRIERGLTDVVNSIDNNLNAFTQQLKHKVEFLADHLGQYGSYDPADQNDQSNHFLGEGRADQIREKLARDLQTANEAASYSKRLGHQSVDAMYAVVNKVQATISQYEANYQKAQQLVRMPEAATEDSGLKKIAQQTLSHYDYVGDIKRMVINTGKQHRSKETSEEKFDDIDVNPGGTITLTGTRTTYFYEWDQFQVATAEAVGERYYIYYSTLKYFTRGAATTPLNKWIISGRIQGAEIPEENIYKK